MTLQQWIAETSVEFFKGSPYTEKHAENQWAGDYEVFKSALRKFWRAQGKQVDW